MDCERATFLISARVDGDAAGGAEVALDAHLAECESCRLTLSEMERQDAALLRAFLPRRRAATDVADKLSEMISARPTAAAAPAETFRRSLKRWTGWAAAAAAGFVAAMVIVRAHGPRSVVVYPPSQIDAPVQPVALVTAATGQVFLCPAAEHSWRPMLVGEPLAPGAGIRTADTAKCELRLSDGSCVRLNSATQARFTAERSVNISTGEIWSSLPPAALPLYVSAGPTSVNARGTASGQTQFDLSYTSDTATLTVACGTAEVAGSGPPTTVRGGQTLRAPAPPAVYVCSAAPNSPPDSQWQDDLLVHRPPDDPEVVARVEQLLARIAKAPATTCPSEAEQEVRAGGQAWCPPMACYIRSQPAERDNRRAAARLVADLAPPAHIADLIDLLDDQDGEIRFQAATALRRLTGQTLGYPPQMCAASCTPSITTAWREWWKQNKSRYTAQSSH